MRRNQALQNISLAALALGVVTLLGGYWYIQQQKVNDLQQQIDQLPNGKDRVSLVKDRIALENTINGSLIQAVGGILLFVTAYVSVQNLKATQRNVLIAEDKQVTERFTQAINQLGSDKIEARFGGIYALERIAKNSPKDHWTIMEVLVSCIKEAPISMESGQPISRHLQAALTVIGRRDAANDPKDKCLDFRGTCLIQADLQDLNLHRADLGNAILIGANLKRANLQEAKLSHSDLEGADLKETNLHQSIIRAANLSETDLRWADLTGADLNHTNLNGARLWQANLAGADLSGADLSNAVLWQANLSNTNLSGTELEGANLIGTDLRNVRELTLEQVKAGKNWEQAHYDEHLQKQLGLIPKQES
ncbi:MULTISPECIES: pentapeptide repeat-containing protein [Leptolyngbya]|uniref:pentapeptide repeat-containing protein n=1 Tax=Leptolyngbya TaxID=47251 RepID=UPI0016876333|nr:pentapeptide repeat-containing protein [Leptolyngbya sp. FACHB-1624]MBD1855515.1 pentapeptide repeat-containing protein [Leptolyngbya sp. FACHB-1624]